MYIFPDQEDSEEAKRADEGEKEEIDKEARSDEQELEQEDDADKLENTLPGEEAGRYLWKKNCIFVDIYIFQICF